MRKDTGFTDMNGNPIYGGDYVNYPKTTLHPAEITYDEKLGWIMNWHEGNLVRKLENAVKTSSIILVKV